MSEGPSGVDSAPFDGLDDWLRSVGFAPLDVRPLVGDVSPRRYARVRLAAAAGTPTAIAAFYPAAVAAACERFRRATELLAGAQIPVPAILAADCAAGWMLVEDVGERTLHDHGDRPWEELEPPFATAAALVPRIAALDHDAVAALNPPLDDALLARELRQTWELLLVPLGVEADAGLARAVEAAFDALATALGGGSLVPCHRDLMARNLVPRGPWPGPALAVLDHQDLRCGPAAYDLASLLNDSLFPPPAVEERLLAIAGCTNDEGYRRAVVQRTLKACGTYLAFAARGARRHLPLVTPTLGRAAAHLTSLPETADCAAALAGLWRQERLARLLH